MPSELPPRQKSMRVAAKTLQQQQHQHQHDDHHHSMKSRVINNNLYPGLNDITDSFEALPLDLIKFFTLLKEIDAKCINSVPTLNNLISSFLKLGPDGHPEKNKMLTRIKDLIKELMPCIEEKMHVATVASDLIQKHLVRINDDYNLIINTEIPESVRIGPMIHPAMIIDNKLPENRTAQSARSESRREALAAKKATHTEDDEKDSKRKKPRAREEAAKPLKELTPTVNNKKRRIKEQQIGIINFQNEDSPQDISRPSTPNGKRVKTAKKPKEYPTSQPEYATTSLIVHPEHELSPEIGVADDEDPPEPVYCYCNQISFGEMVGCDGDSCKREWFHLTCIGLKSVPKGKWYCEECSNKNASKKKK